MKKLLLSFMALLSAVGLFGGATMHAQAPQFGQPYAAASLDWRNSDQDPSMSLNTLFGVSTSDYRLLESDTLVIASYGVRFNGTLVNPSTNGQGGDWEFDVKTIDGP